MHNEFVARGLFSRDEARRKGEYFPAEDVFSDLEGMLSQAEAKARK
jgi:hypothetical protein